MLPLWPEAIGRMATEPVLVVQDLTVRYGTAVAVDALCLEVRPGEVFGLLGPNGSGKSSTLAAVSGDLKPAAGVLRICGLSPEDDPLTYRRQLGLVPQELALYEDLSGEENLLFFGRLFGLAGRTLRSRVAEVLELVRITEPARRLVRTWSGGMQRRLNLACALLHRPTLLLLDEPTVGLDLHSRDAVVEVLHALRDRGCAVVLASHHLDEVERVCDRVGIMNSGRLLALGTIRELTALLEPEAPIRLHLYPGTRSGAASEQEGAEQGMPAPAGGALEQLFRRLTERSRAAA